jgi:aromatic ring hydroxylase-like protein
VRTGHSSPWHASIEDYHTNAVTGSLAPHAWLSDRRSIIDLHGRGFTLVRFGDSTPDVSAIAHAFASRAIPLSVETVDNPAIGLLYERRLVLVRPDRHVAWRGDAPPADPLASDGRSRAWRAGIDKLTIPSRFMAKSVVKRILASAPKHQSLIAFASSAMEQRSP